MSFLEGYILARVSFKGEGSLYIRILKTNCAKRVNMKDLFRCQPLNLESSRAEMSLHVPADRFHATLWTAVVHADSNRVTIPELCLQVLYAPQAFEMAVDHDSQARTQGFTFLHAENTCHNT